MTLKLVVAKHFLSILAISSILFLSGCGGGGGENVIADNDDNNVIDNEFNNLVYSSYTDENANALVMARDDHVGHRYVLPSISAYADIDKVPGQAATSVNRSGITSETAAIEFTTNGDPSALPPEADYLISVIDTDAEKSLSFSTVLADEPNPTTEWGGGVNEGDDYVGIVDTSNGTDKTVVFFDPNGFNGFDYQIFGVWSESDEIDDLDVGLFSSGMRTDINDAINAPGDNFQEGIYSGRNNATGAWIDSAGNTWSVYGDFEATVNFARDLPTMDMTIGMTQAVDENDGPAPDFVMGELDLESVNPITYDVNTGMFEGVVVMQDQREGANYRHYRGNAAATFYGPIAGNNVAPAELGGITSLSGNGLETLGFSFGGRCQNCQN